MGAGYNAVVTLVEIFFSAVVLTDICVIAYDKRKSKKNA
jgi:hypothetical protein